MSGAVVCLKRERCVGLYGHARGSHFALSVVTRIFRFALCLILYVVAFLLMQCKLGVKVDSYRQINIIKFVLFLLVVILHQIRLFSTCHFCYGVSRKEYAQVSGSF